MGLWKVKRYKKPTERDLLGCEMITPQFHSQSTKPANILNKAKITYIMMFPEWLPVGNSEESDSNLYDKNTHKTVNSSHGLGVIYFLVLYQMKILNS